jgi:hypothetical protein
MKLDIYKIIEGKYIHAETLEVKTPSCMSKHEELEAAKILQDMAEARYDIDTHHWTYPY